MAVSRLLQSTLQNAFSKYNSVWDGRSAVGSMEAISAVTLSASQSTVEFNNIPQTYSHLQVRVLLRGTYAGASRVSYNVQVNKDTGDNYSQHSLSGNGSVITVTGYASQPQMNIAWITASTSNSSLFSAGVIDFLDYSSTNKNKTMRCLQGNDRNGAGEITLTSGCWLNNTTGITSIQMFPY